MLAWSTQLRQGFFLTKCKFNNPSPPLPSPSCTVFGEVRKISHGYMFYYSVDFLH